MSKGARVIAYLAVAAVAAILFTALGDAVSHAPLDALDLAARPLAGEATSLAAVFTISCLFPVLASLGVILLVVAIFAKAWRERIVTSVLTTLIFWKVMDALKAAFGRPRPPYWHVFHETSPSYPSGHAMFATIVYVLWAWFVWNSDLPAPLRRVVAPFLVLWACGVVWSRLALGAHYPTDLAGGVLLGIVALALGAAIRAGIASRRRGATTAAAAS